MRPLQWTLALSVFVATLISPCILFAQPSGPMPKDIGFDPHFGATVARDVQLVAEDGSPHTLGDYLDGRRPVILVLAYYECPMLCTMVLNGAVNALKRVDLRPGDDFEVLVVSIDPADTPERAAAKKASYVGHYDRPGAERGLHFMTGREEEVRRLAAAVGFKYVYDPIGKQFAHPAGLLVLTGDGTISRYLYGVDFPPRDMRLALVEAAQGSIGTPADRLLLLCFHYDPAQGKYGAIALTAVRIGGVVTMIAIGLLLAKQIAPRRRRA